MNPETLKKVLEAQKNEITEYYIYKELAERVKHKKNKIVLNHIAVDEIRHYNFFKKISKREIDPDKFKIWWFSLITKILGLTFGIKLLENDEEKAQLSYDELVKHIPNAKKVLQDEEDHEKQLINLIDEEKLKYVGSIVLGLNDALVELTGALAGLTFALQNTKLVALTGLITGIAASLSMAASEYLSTKSEGSSKNPVKSAVYTGIAYIFTVFFLIFPYFIFNSIYIPLAFTLVNAVIIIFLFTYYVSVTKEVSFKKRFWEMVAISLGVAFFTFIIGYFVRSFFNIDI